MGSTARSAAQVVVQAAGAPEGAVPLVGPAPRRGVLGLANPTRFLAFADRTIPLVGAAAFAVIAYGLYLAFGAPAEYQHGDTVRIMFVHVPSAWLALGVWVVMAFSALGTLVWRHPMADVAAKSAAPLGAAFTFLCLATGSLWGRPAWGTWWEWDGRMTSVFVLFLMYLGVLALWRAVEDPARAGRAAAIVALVGLVNLPIIRFSVDRWNTLHQPASVIRAGGPSIHADLLTPLLVMALGFLLAFVALHLAFMRNEVLRRRVRALEARAAAEGVTVEGSGARA